MNGPYTNDNERILRATGTSPSDAVGCHTQKITFWGVLILCRRYSRSQQNKQVKEQREKVNEKEKLEP